MSQRIIITDEQLPMDEFESRFDCMDCNEPVCIKPQTTNEYAAESNACCMDCYATRLKSALLEKSQESGQQLKDALLKAEQDNLALQMRIIKLESDLATREDGDYSSYRLMAKHCMAKDEEISELAQKCLAERRAKTSVELKLKCVEGERDRYKEERDKAEKEVERLTMLIEDMERGFSSDE